jgi:hypothetical protein
MIYWVDGRMCGRNLVHGRRDLSHGNAEPSVVWTDDPCTVTRPPPMHGRVGGRPALPTLRGSGGRAWFGGWLAIVLALALLLPGCHSGGSPPPPTSSGPTTSGSPDSATAIVRRNALAAYQAMWADMAAAARTADYKSPLLPQHAAKAALSLLVRGLYTDKRLGIVVKGTPVTNARVVSVSPASNPTTALRVRAGHSGRFVALIAAIGAEAERGPTLRLGEEG